MYFVFDIGGTNMRVGVSSDGQAIKNSKIVPTPQNFDQGIQALKQAADELSNGEQITAVAGGVPGTLNKEKSILLAAPQIHGWISEPLKQELEKAFYCKVILENDTFVGGLGEASKGAGAGKNVVAYLAIGTGVGGKRIINGKISKENSNFEPGHIIIVPDGNKCNCGSRGCLESYVAGAYLERIYGQRGENIKNPQSWDQVAKYLSIGLVNITVLWSPDIIVLGGNVSKSIPLDKVKSYINQYLKTYPQAPEMVLAALGSNTGFYGALELLK